MERGKNILARWWVVTLLMVLVMTVAGCRLCEIPQVAQNHPGLCGQTEPPIGEDPEDENSDDEGTD